MGRSDKASRRRREKEWKRRQRDAAQTVGTPTLGIAPWIRDRSIECPCGTGRSFAECCDKLIGGLGQTASAAFSETDLEHSERVSRAKFTQYLGWVHRHTLELIRSGIPEATTVVQMDIEALSAAVECVAGIMRARAHAADAIALFENAARVVPLPTFDERMLATKAVWLDGVLGDEAGARSLLSAVDPHKATDHRLLESYLAIVKVPDPFERVRISDRALAAVTEPLPRSWNLTTKALYLLLAGDYAGSRSAVTDAVAAISDLNLMESSLFERLTAARSYAMKWNLCGGEDDFAKAIQLYESIDLSELTVEGKADIHHQIGTMQGDHGDLNSAIEHLELSQSLHRENGCGVRLFDLYVQSGRFESAHRLAAELQAAALSSGSRAEFLTARATLAVREGDEASLRLVINALIELEIDERYFAHGRDKACIRLLRILDDSENWRAPRPKGVLLRLLRGLATICEYLELKPNVLGLGLNLNRMIEDLNALGQARTSSLQDRVDGGQTQQDRPST